MNAIPIAENDIHIMPYTTSDGVPTFRDSEIKNVYDRVWAEGWGEHVFCDGSITSAEQFLQLMKSPHNALHLVYYKEELVAMVWLNRIEQTHCYVHWTFFKNIMGSEVIYEIGTAVIDFMFDNYGFQVLMGITPSFNKAALWFLRRIGLKKLGEIPNILYHLDNQEAIPGTFMYINREDRKDESNN